jgi:NTE family protein
MHLDQAEKVIGTSAGSVVGARLGLGRDLAAEIARTYGSRATAPRARSESYESSMGPRMAQLRELMTKAATHEGPREQVLREMGKFAVDAETPPEESFVAFFADLAGAGWPAGFACTAVDTGTGEFTVWDEHSDVPLQLAVASSCSVPGIYPPITVNGVRYMDGGMRSALNADLAAGADSVLVVSVTATPPADATVPFLIRIRESREAELAVLADSGAKATVIEPDAAFNELTGGGLYLMDAARAPAAYDVGLAQAEQEAERLAGAWS